MDHTYHRLYFIRVILEQIVNRYCFVIERNAMTFLFNYFEMIEKTEKNVKFYLLT